MGMTFAQEIGATFLYDPSIWKRKGSHGRYGWMVDFLPLQEIELTKGDQEFQDKRAIQNEMELTTKTGTWESIVNYSKEENPCYAELGTVLHLCPAPEGKSGTIWCSEDPNRIGDFDAVKGRMREAYSRSKYSPSKQLPELLGINNTETFSFIVWHLRVGDIVLNNNKEFFSSLSKQIVSAFQNSGMVPLVVFLGEGGEEATGKSFPFLHDICDEFFSAKCFYPVIDVRDSLYYMIHADILVTSGSSFPAVAATLRTRGMTLSAGAKPKEIREIYETSEQLQIELESGTVQNIDALKRYLQKTGSWRRQ